MSSPLSWTESDYRKEVQKTLDRIEAAFAHVDPDVAECEVAMGAMTITLADGSRLILSMQPSVRQIWLALAAKGTAHHFSYDSGKSRWMDDKGRGLELISFLEDYFRDSCGIDLKIS